MDGPNVPSSSEADVCQVARLWAESQGLRWTEPTDCNFDPEARIWAVRSNAHGKGFSVLVSIEDATKAVVAHHTFPR